MENKHRRKQRPPLDRASLHELALAYVGRFATTRAKLAAYLSRKVRERGWESDLEPPIAALVQRFADTGLIDDGAYALAKAHSLVRRGYGTARIGQSLRAAGVDDEDREEAMALSREDAVDAALTFARKRRLGPFAKERIDDRKARERALAAMQRAGHEKRIALAILALDPGTEVNEPDLLSQFR